MSVFKHHYTISEIYREWGTPGSKSWKKKNPSAQLCKETCTEKPEPHSKNSGKTVLYQDRLSRAKQEAIQKTEIKNTPTA